MFMATTGQEIIGPDHLIDYKPDVVIIMNQIYQDEIKTDLNRRGLDPEILAL
jgi:hypothetical protein